MNNTLRNEYLKCKFTWTELVDRSRNVGHGYVESPDHALTTLHYNQSPTLHSSLGSQVNIIRAAAPRPTIHWRQQPSIAGSRRAHASPPHQCPCCTLPAPFPTLPDRPIFFLINALIAYHHRSTVQCHFVQSPYHWSGLFTDGLLVLTELLCK